MSVRLTRMTRPSYKATRWALVDLGIGESRRDAEVCWCFGGAEPGDLRARHLWALRALGHEWLARSLSSSCIRCWRSRMVRSAPSVLTTNISTVVVTLLVEYQR